MEAEPSIQATTNPPRVSSRGTEGSRLYPSGEVPAPDVRTRHGSRHPSDSPPVNEYQSPSSRRPAANGSGAPSPKRGRPPRRRPAPVGRAGVQTSGLLRFRKALFHDALARKNCLRYRLILRQLRHLRVRNHQVKPAAAGSHGSHPLKPRSRHGRCLARAPLSSRIGRRCRLRGRQTTANRE
jgi:hypothetical protein